MNNEVEQKVHDFFAGQRLRKYEKGQVLLLNGDVAEHIFYLSEGQVKQYDVTYRGEEVILNVFKPGAFFPMSLAISAAPSPYIFEAETDVELYQAPAGEVIEFIKQNPDVLYDLLTRVYRGVDGMIGRMVQLMSGSAKSRLIYELIIEARRQVGKDKNTCTLNLGEKELGSRTGLSRETISREAHHLKADNLIEIRNKQVIIHDLAALENTLGHEL